MAFNNLLANKSDRLIKRAAIIQAIRMFFLQEGYLEVETPLLLPTLAPETHIDPTPAGKLFLQTSPEICMKRLVAAGYRRIFQISHCWRAGERGSRHIPEFTMLEWYRADADYRSLMTETEDMIRFVHNSFSAATGINYRNSTIDLVTGWEYLTVKEAFLSYTDYTMEQALLEDHFDLLMVDKIEPRLGRGTPSFLFDYPACRSALAKLKDDDKSVAERFELYIAGIELANGFSELNDPAEQRTRFQEEYSSKVSSGGAVSPLPEKFLAELDQMPQTAGIAMGIDRLVMLLTDAETIDQVVTFTPEEL